MDRPDSNHITFIRAIFLMILTTVLTLSGWSLWKINQMDEAIHDNTINLINIQNEVVEMHRGVRNLEIYVYPQRQIPPQ